MQEFQQHGMHLLAALEEKQIKEIEENRQVQEEKLSTKYKPSPELLNLRKIQANLAKQKE
jgi:hypothetical protein